MILVSHGVDVFLGGLFWVALVQSVVSSLFVFKSLHDWLVGGMFPCVFKQQLLKQVEVHPSLEKVTPATEGRVLKSFWWGVPSVSVGVVPSASPSSAASSSATPHVGVLAILLAIFPQGQVASTSSTSLFLAASASMAALRPLQRCRRSLVLNDLAVVCALSKSFFVA